MKKVETTRIDKRDANRDPLSGEPGAHPVGVGVGAAGAGAAAGALGGAIGGPVGAAIGAAAGAIAGGYAGKAVAEKVDPTVEDKYWKTTYTSRPYVEKGATYDQYGPAYRYGWESCCQYTPSGKRFDDVEPHLSRDWDVRRGTSKLSWDKAKDAVRDGWSRAERRPSETDETCI